jgi:hypothetical protein
VTFIGVVDHVRSRRHQRKLVAVMSRHLAVMSRHMAVSGAGVMATVLVLVGVYISLVVRVLGGVMIGQLECLNTAVPLGPVPAGVLVSA